jgi:dienelactone hydrolase
MASNGFDQRFQAAIAYSPFCAGQAAAVAVPTLILIGERDDWTPAKDCRAMMARRKAFGAELRLVVYPEAHHAFNLELPPRRSYGHRVEYDAAAAGAAGLRAIAGARPFASVP